MGSSSIRGAVGLGHKFTCQNFSSPPKKVHAFQHELRDVIAHKFIASACTVAWFTELLTSMSLVLGPVVRLWTRSLHWGPHPTSSFVG